MILGLSHIALYANDLDRAARLYGDTLGGRPITLAHGPNQRAFDLGGVRLVLMQGEAPARSDEHIALRTSAGALETMQARLDALGLRTEVSRPRGEAALSLYFVDWDGHLIELHADAP